MLLLPHTRSYLHCLYLNHDPIFVRVRLKSSPNNNRSGAISEVCCHLQWVDRQADRHNSQQHWVCSEQAGRQNSHMEALGVQWAGRQADRNNSQQHWVCGRQAGTTHSSIGCAVGGQAGRQAGRQAQLTRGSIGCAVGRQAGTTHTWQHWVCSGQAGRHNSHVAALGVQRAGTTHTWQH